MNTTTSKSFNRAVALAMLLLGCLMVTASVEAKSAPATGHILSPADMQKAMPGSTLNDLAYAEVNSQWLKQFYGTFREELFRNDPVKAEKRLNCPRFAGYYAEMAQARFSAEAFHDTMQARALALGTVWYTPEGSTVAHAVVVAITERGRLFIDPKTGNEIALSAKEITTSYRRMF